MEILTFTMLYVVAKGGIWFRYNSMFIYISTAMIGLFRKNIFCVVTYSFSSLMKAQYFCLMLCSIYKLNLIFWHLP